MLEILIVDDHPLLRAGLECLLGTTQDLHVVGSAISGEDALRLAEQLAPDVVLMDLCMPGMNGLDATRRLRQLQPAPTVVVLTTACAAALVLDAFAAGAAGYLVKDMPPDRLVAALRGLAEGRPAIDPRAARILSRQRRRVHEDAGMHAGLASTSPQD